jgi:hypothetical protein
LGKTNNKVIQALLHGELSFDMAEAEQLLRQNNVKRKTQQRNTQLENIPEAP